MAALAAAQAHDPVHASSLAHGLSHLMIDGAFDGLPLKQQDPDTLARVLGERLFGASTGTTTGQRPDGSGQRTSRRLSESPTKM